jgi:hypothetical protein
MQQWLKRHGIDARVKYLETGSLKRRWRLYNPRVQWTEELAAKLNELGFTDFDGTPLGKYSGNGGVFSVFVKGHDELLDDATTASLVARELVKVAKELMAGVPSASYQLAEELKRVPGVADAVVNDFARVSEGTYEVDVHVYGDPMTGGKLTMRLKRSLPELMRKLNLAFNDMWSPRQDREMKGVGQSALIKFYQEHPWKVTVTDYSEARQGAKP